FNAIDTSLTRSAPGPVVEPTVVRVEAPERRPAEAPVIEGPLPAPRAIVREEPIPELAEPVIVPTSIVDAVETVETPPVEGLSTDGPSPATSNGNGVQDASPPEPVEPVAPPVTRAATPTAAPRASRPAEASTELLKGLQIPANLSSQWRRILRRAVEAP